MSFSNEMVRMLRRSRIRYRILVAARARGPLPVGLLAEAAGVPVERVEGALRGDDRTFDRRGALLRVGAMREARRESMVEVELTPEGERALAWWGERVGRGRGE